MEHAELVTKLRKRGEDILRELTPQQADLWHMASCVSSEAGELFDGVKKHVIYRKPIDRENMVEELGDLEFYLEGIRQCLAITREECLVHNVAKLTVRYGEKFSNEAAQARKDKEGDHVQT